MKNKPIKLSQQLIDVLTRLQKLNHMSRNWIPTDRIRGVTTERLNVLVGKGLVEKRLRRHYSNRYEWYITEAGKNFLK